MSCKARSMSLYWNTGGDIRMPEKIAPLVIQVYLSRTSKAFFLTSGWNVHSWPRFTPCQWGQLVLWDRYRRMGTIVTAWLEVRIRTLRVQPFCFAIAYGAKADARVNYLNKGRRGTICFAWWVPPNDLDHATRHRAKAGTNWTVDRHASHSRPTRLIQTISNIGSTPPPILFSSTRFIFSPEDM